MSIVTIFTSNLAISNAQNLFENRAESPGSGLVASSMSGRLKSQLLENLNKYSNNAADGELEVLGSSDNSNPEKPRQITSFGRHEDREDRTTFWKPLPPSSTPSLLQSLFGGLPFSLPTLPPLFAPLTLAPPVTTRPIQNFFDSQVDASPGIFGREDRFGGAQAQNIFTVAITPIPFTLPSLQPPSLGISWGAPYASGSRARRPHRYDNLESEIEPSSTFPATTTTVSLATMTTRPRYINYKPTRPPYITDSIRDWRKRFYKLFKTIKHRNYTSASPTKSTIEPLSLPKTPTNEENTLDNEPLPRPDVDPEPIRIFQKRPEYTRRMQPIIVVNDSRAAEVDKNKQILMSQRNPNFISEQKVKLFARDGKGRIVRLYGVENGGYKFEEDPLPLPPLDPQNADYYQGNAVAPPGGTVYIPAGIPSTLAPPPPAYRIYRPALPPAPEPIPTPVTSATYVPQLVSSLPLSPVEFPTLATTPPPCVAPTTAVSYNNRISNSNYDTSEYETLDELPCEQMACSGQNMMPVSPIIGGGDIGPPFIENNERCNSIRLRFIIEQSIVAGDAEASKRIIQARAETELVNFYNVICGTGFFSYIAHTDEFCQASAFDINCYVFSPVCSYQSAYSDGLALKSKSMKSKTRRRKKARKKAFLNRN